MRHYQPKNKNPYQLPHNVYMQCLYAVRDYDRLKQEVQDILHDQAGQHDPTGQKAIRRAHLQERCDAIEQALNTIPQEYRRGVIWITQDEGHYPIDASPETYRRWRRRFLYEMAQRLWMV